MDNPYFQASPRRRALPERGPHDKVANMAPTFVILAALVEETAAILRSIKSKPLTPALPVFSACYELDLDENLDCPRRYGVLAQLERMGRVSAAVSTVYALHTWEPSIVIIAGTAGGFRDQGVALGDVLVATEIVDYEIQRLDDDPTIRWVTYQPASSLLETARKARLPVIQGRQPKVHFGPILSGDKVVASEAVAKKLLSWRPDVLGVEMEGAGVAFVSKMNSVPFLMVRGVADYADAKKREDASQWSQAACESVARLIRILLVDWAKEGAAQKEAER